MKFNDQDFVAVETQKSVFWDNTNTEYSCFEKMFLALELTNICNFKCSFCPHKKMTRKQGILSEPLFRKIIDEAASIGIKKVMIIGLGEPLFDKNLVERIAYMKQNGMVLIDCTTNGSLLSADILDEVFDAGLTRLNLSLAPYREFVETRSQEQAAKLFVMLRLLKGNRHLKSISINYTSTGRATPKEEKEFFAFLNDIGVSVYSVNPTYNWGSREKICAIKSKQLCSFLWHPTVLWDGRVIYCRADVNGDTEIGNLNNQTLRDVLNCEAIRVIRRNQLAGKFLKPCLNCNLPEMCARQGEDKLLSLRYLWNGLKLCLFHSRTRVVSRPTIFAAVEMLLLVFLRRIKEESKA